MDVKNFDRSQFKRMKPNLHQSQVLAVSVMADHTVRLNALLNKKMMRETGCKFLCVSYWGERRQILLEPRAEFDEDTLTVPKNGAFSLHYLCDALAAGGIKLPAYFIVERLPGERAWLGMYKAEHRFPIPKITEERLKKPRKSDLSSMLPKEKNE